VIGQEKGGGTRSLGTREREKTRERERERERERKREREGGGGSEPHATFKGTPQFLYLCHTY
jgi:hypothetical protein